MLIRGTAQLIYKVGASIGSAARLRILRRGQHSDDTSLGVQEWSEVEARTAALLVGKEMGLAEIYANEHGEDLVVDRGTFPWLPVIQKWNDEAEEYDKKVEASE